MTTATPSNPFRPAPLPAARYNLHTQPHGGPLGTNIIKCSDLGELQSVARAEYADLHPSDRAALDMVIVDSETSAEVWRYGAPSGDWTKQGLRGLKLPR